MLSSARSACLLLPLYLLTSSSIAVGVTSTTTYWDKFETARKSVRALHQEFEVSQVLTFGYGGEEASHYNIKIDLSDGKWRQESIGGSRNPIHIFDGQDLLLVDPEETEYVRIKQKDKQEPLPEPYDAKLDWGKAKELKQLPCGYSGKDHTCVIIEAPVKPWIRPRLAGEMTKMTGGVSRVMIDTETGIWLNCWIEAEVEARTTYRADITFSIKRLGYGGAPDAALFKLPNGDLREVKELTPWDERQIKNQLAGKPAPELRLKDVHGNAISLSDLKGKTVLLDFWTTWCPPCQADAPELDKLNQKYGSKDLAIIGISVDEARETVEKFLKKHPHQFPVVLSSENSMPLSYRVDEFPTYMIVTPDGMLMTAEAGDQGFGRLRKVLEKAGMHPE